MLAMGGETDPGPGHGKAARRLFPGPGQEDPGNGPKQPGTQMSHARLAHAPAWQHQQQAPGTFAQAHGNGVLASHGIISGPYGQPQHPQMGPHQFGAFDMSVQPEAVGHDVPTWPNMGRVPASGFPIAPANFLPPPAPKNPRKRGWDDEEDKEESENYDMLTSDDAMMVDDGPHSDAGHSNLLSSNRAMASSSSYGGHGQSDGGMLGRFKRVRVDDGPAGTQTETSLPDHHQAQKMHLAATATATAYRDRQQTPSSLPLPQFPPPGPFSPPRPLPGSLESLSGPPYGYSGSMSPSLPGRFKISLRTPAGTPARPPLAGPKTPPASPYADVNKLLGQLHVLHHGEPVEDGESEGPELHQQHHQRSPEDSHSIAQQYEHINNVLRQLEESRSKRRDDRND